MKNFLISDFLLAELPGWRSFIVFFAFSLDFPLLSFGLELLLLNIISLFKILLLLLNTEKNKIGLCLAVVHLEVA